MTRRRRRDGMLRPIAHEFHIADGHVCGGDVFPGHEDVGQGFGVQRAEGHEVRFLVAFVPEPILETEGIFPL